LPPPDEQAAIARFLDYVDVRIRRYIHAQQKLIKLLEEQNQAVIQHAVTQGLQPGVRQRDVALAWLESVPVHWEVTQLKRYWRVTDCKHLTVPFVDEGIPVASVREVQSFDLNLATANKTTSAWYDSLVEGGRRPRRGDLIYCRNVSVGACAYVGTDEKFAMGQDVCLIQSAGQNQRYLNYLLHSPFMKQQLSQGLIGSTFNRINVADVRALTVLVPPRQEQDAITAYLDSVLIKATQMIRLINEEINFVHEYRIRLMADVVTGKLDVREVAANLPDQVEVLDDMPLEDAEHTRSDDAELLADEPAEEGVTV
jgi:type I restriction enzyme S subunit